SHVMSMLGVVGARYLQHQMFMNVITSIADYMTQGLRGEEGNAGKNLGDMLSRLAVPAVLGKTAQAVDPVERELKSFVDEWKEKIPGWSLGRPLGYGIGDPKAENPFEGLPPHRNGFGEPHFIAGGYKPEDAPGFWRRMENFLSPMPAERVDDDPLASEMERLGIDNERPPRAIGGKAPSNSPFKAADPTGALALDDKQFDRLQVIAGNANGELGDIPSKREYMEDMIKGDDYKQLSDIRKKEWLRQANKTYNQLAVDQLKQEDPSILSGMITNKTKEIAARNGISVGTP